MKNKVQLAAKNKRLFAFGIDWYLGNVFAMVPVAYLWTMMSGKAEINTQLKFFPGNMGYVAGLLSIVFSLIYHFIVPVFLWKGQTLGKKILGIKIVKADYSEADIKFMALRQIIGICLMEGIFIQSGECLVEMLGMLFGELFKNVMTYLLVAVFVISLLMFFKTNKALHDYLFKTAVIDIKGN